MSNVVAFRPEQTGRPVVRRREEGAAILFFTGVRYVREEMPVTPAGQEAQQVDPVAARDCDFSTERLKA